jgi:hypothetical protein
VRKTENVSQSERRVCALGSCGEAFELSARASNKRFCSERCRRIEERRRWRAWRFEWATCKGCGRPFERVAASKRLQVFCTTVCQYRTRSVEYAGRPDIQAGIARAREAAAA